MIWIFLRHYCNRDWGRMMTGDKIIASLKTIYSHMADRYSKQLFGNRLLYSLTGDQVWVEEIINMTEEGKVFIQKLNQKDTQENIIFGTGAWGKGLLRSFPDFRWDYFVDNHVKENEIAGIPVIAFKELYEKHNKATVVIATRLYHKEILQQLMEHGFSEENIINMGKMVDDMSRKQYFDLSYLPHKDREVFVDCGCFDGRTSLLFTKWCHGNYEHIFAFEPDKDNYEKCKMTLEELDDISVLNFGLWDKTDVLHFNAISTGASSIIEDGGTEINVKALDDVLDHEAVTFIKMDVEGSELKTLRGGGQNYFTA